MIEINDRNDQDQDPLSEINKEDNQLQTLDDLITRNAELLNNNKDISPRNDDNIINKEHNKSSENEPLTKKHETSGVINVPIHENNEPAFLSNQDTLNESILTTIYRDLYQIYTKLKFVVIPYGSKSKKSYHIKQWDLWGPLILNLLLAITLAAHAKEKSHMIISIFVIFWLGGIILFLNANFLGVKSSIFQIFCLLGYCLFPLNLSALFVTIIKVHGIFKLFIVISTCIWSIYSSSDFLKTITNQDQRYLVLYPCILFYLYISWFIISTNN
jgi:hypothetical protein